MSTKPPSEKEDIRREVRGLKKIIQNQQEQIQSLQASIASLRTPLKTTKEIVDGIEISRRDALISGVGLTAGAGLTTGGLLAFGPQRASATVKGNMGTNADPLITVFAETIDPGTSGSAVTLAGGLLPDTDSSHDLGADATRWENLYVDAGSIDGSKDIPGVPATSSDPGRSFGAWNQVSATRPAFVEIEALAETDGSTDGRVAVLIDESGGTSADYTFEFALARSTLPAGAQVLDTISFLLPAGAQYQIQNASDPNTANAIRDVREFVM